MQQRGFTIIEVSIAMVVISAIVLMGLRLSEQFSVRAIVSHNVSQARLLHDALDAYYYEECGATMRQQPTLTVIENDYLILPFEWPAYVTDIQLHIPSWGAGNSHSSITFTYEQESIADRVDRAASNSIRKSARIVEFKRLFSTSNNALSLRLQMDQEIFGNNRC